MRTLLRWLAAAVALAALFPAAGAAAADQRCSNEEMLELRCDGGDCAAAAPTEFTPMRLSLDSAGLQLCAYSDCLSGPVQLMAQMGGHRIVGGLLRSESGMGGEAQVSVVFDEPARMAVVRFRDFVLPMRCADPD